jgi:hypothetical protein
MMADLQNLFQTIETLTPDEVKQLYEYILENHIQFTAKADVTLPKPRVIGLHEHLGTGWMSDDLNDELPDSFWLGEA